MIFGDMSLDTFKVEAAGQPSLSHHDHAAAAGVPAWLATLLVLPAHGLCGAPAPDR
jgi:hypothetical protein